MRCRFWALLPAALCLLSFQAAHADQPQSKPIEFNRDIRPILSDTCFVCHGPDSNLRKKKLRLDQEKDVLADRGGYQIIVPGKPEESELYLRITGKEGRK